MLSNLQEVLMTLAPNKKDSVEAVPEPAVPKKPAFPTLIIKGERHTGTHWLSQILRHNFPSKDQKLHLEPTIPGERCPFEQPFPEFQETMCCWTSGLADDRCVYDSAPTVYVFVVRHPYPWLLSMKKKPFEYDRDAEGITLSQYMRWPFVQFAKERIGVYANPLDMYNKKIRSYLNVTTHPKIILHHEDLYDLSTLNRKLLQPLLKQASSCAPTRSRWSTRSSISSTASTRPTCTSSRRATSTRPRPTRPTGRPR